MLWGIMQQAKSDFSVKLQGNFRTPEIRKLFSKWPQTPYSIFLFKQEKWGKDANQAWKALDENSKKPYYEESSKQKALSKEIKELAQKRYSLAQALNEIDSNLSCKKEEYLKTRVSQKRSTVKKPRPFDKFKAEWLEKNGTTECDKKLLIQQVSKAWAGLSVEQKATYRNPPAIVSSN